MKNHQTTLLSLVSLRPNDAVNFNVFKYGIQAILLAKGKTQTTIFIREEGHIAKRAEMKIRTH